MKMNATPMLSVNLRAGLTLAAQGPRTHLLVRAPPKGARPTARPMPRLMLSGSKNCEPGRRG